MAYTELSKREDSVSLWKKLLANVNLTASALVSILSVPLSNISFIAALVLLGPSVGFALFSLHRGIKGAERLMYSLTPNTLTIERYRGAVEIPVAAIEYLRVVRLDDVNVPNSFPGHQSARSRCRRSARE